MARYRLAGLALTGCWSLAMFSSAGFALSADWPPPLVVTLKPGAPDSAGHVPYVDVEMIVPGVAVAAGEPLLDLPAVANTVVTSARTLQDFGVEDDRGRIDVTASERSDDDSNITRIWKAARAASGTLKVHYRVPIDAASSLLAAPQYEIRTDDGTFSAAGNAFLALPADDRLRRVRVHWDMSASGPGATAASSFGVGDATTAEAFSPDRLRSSYFMAGRPGLYRSPTKPGAFFAAWQGQPPFDATELMGWADRLHGYYGKFFRNSPPSFGVFMRPNARNPGSGIGLTHSFAFTYNGDSKAAGLRLTLAHEMLHAWVNSLDASMDGAGGLVHSWFGEGLAVYYERTLPLRAGLITPAEFLDNLNGTAGRYYTSAMIGVPNAEIPARFWQDTRVRTLPYDRGSLYFAKLDADIRRASGGKRSLDDLVRAMLALRDQGKRMGLLQWEVLLRAELGRKGLADFQAMLAGKTVLPPSGAFGPCFRRTTRPLRRYVLGFEPAVLRQTPRIVKGLIPGSAAALAGVRDGDEILQPVSQDGIQGKQNAYLTLDLRRDGKDFQIRYLPRGETVQAYQWELDPAHKTGACAG